MWFWKESFEDLLLEKISMEKLKKLNKFIKLRFGDLISEGYGDFETNKDEILYELEDANIIYIGNLNDIIPDNFEFLIKKHNVKLNYFAVLRFLVLLTDVDKYLERYAKSYYLNWNIRIFKPYSDFLFDLGISYSYIEDFADKKVV